MSLIKVVISVAVVFNAWLLLSTPHLQKRFVRGIHLLNYQSDVFSWPVQVLAPELSLITTWILLIVCGMQCTILMSLLTKSWVPRATAMLGLVMEGAVYIALAELNRMDAGHGWLFIAAAVTLLRI